MCTHSSAGMTLAWNIGRRFASKEKRIPLSEHPPFNFGVGERSVVGANAVVTKDVPPFSVVGGVPARLISRIDQSIRPGH